MKKTKFAAQIFKGRAEIEPEEKPKPKARAKPKPKPATAAEARRGPGRPPGKRSSEAYQSVTTFLLKQTYLDTQRALIGTGRDFGDLVDDLLAEWLKRRNSKTSE
jgi:hypothetical protein